MDQPTKAISAEPRRKSQLRYESFAREYVIDLNGTRAAIAAGYSQGSAASQASRLLTKRKVLALIDRFNTERASRVEIRAEKVLEELGRIAFANMQDYIRIQDGEAYIDFSALSRDQAAAIQEVTVEEYSEGRGEDKRNIKRTKFKLAEKRGALELLGKYHKLFTDKLEHSGIVTYESADPSRLTDDQLAQAEGLVESAYARSDPE